jgi:hypothetical protein
MMPPTLLPGTSIKFSLCEQSAKPIRHPKQNLCPVADKKLIGFTLHMMINADFHFFSLFSLRDKPSPINGRLVEIAVIYTIT